ncbi:hypothetical protein B566_EDAN010719 [Ephemera danica]|nr:hypothetical protein B566_EDAN010719 [Ephemera danica]
MVEATLLVNIKGCGYPPQVQCSDFWKRYGNEGARFPCHYSRKNASLVMPTYSKAEHVATIANFFVIPFIITTVASIALCAMHCDCREVTISRVETMTPRGPEDEDEEELTVSSSIRPL